MPSLLGESDLLKTIKLLPGVQSIAEGNTGFYVRGGGPDQNLILLDGAPLYNASHLFGFFSIFNTNAVDHIKLIKGGMPASYGGRLSSVLDITTITGSDTAKHGSGGVGVIAAKLTVAGPLKKKKSSYAISGRRTYVDLLAQPILNAIEPNQKWGYFFYDLNAKLNFDLSPKDKLFVSGYFGRDVFSVKNRASGFGLKTVWGNGTGVVGYTHIFNNKWLMKSSLIYTSYVNQIQISQGDFLVKLSSGINDFTNYTDFHFFPDSIHHIQAGVHYTFHTFLPTNIAAKTDEVESLELGTDIRLYSHDLAIYASDEFDINKKLRLSAGLRYSFFQHIGPFDRYVKNETNHIVDTVKYKPGETVAEFQHLEPRISLRVKLRPASALKVSFVQNYQYIHLASYSTVSLPSDVWIPSTDIVQPQFSTQYALGYFKNFQENRYETSLEGFYKLMKNQIEYQDGFTPEDDVLDNADNNLVFGDGKAYGVELYVKKVKGKATGWIGYTISTTKRQFDDINFGEEFFAKYDRLHDLSLYLAYDLNEKWQFSTVFVYASGNTTTMPIARYIIEGKILTEYGRRNSFRMPAYHRMDLGATYHPKNKKNRKYESTWVFAIYNVYNRNNPYFIYFDDSNFYNEGIFETKAKQVSLFPLMPSVSWNFTF